MRIAHIAFWTRDLDRSASFWSATFGATVGEPYESARRPGFVSRFVSLQDGATVELMTAPWLETSLGGGDREGWAHVAVSLGSEQAVRDLADRMSSQGVLVEGPRWTGDGFFEAVVSDPDGNLVEITI